MSQRAKDRPPPDADHGESRRKHLDQLLDQALEDTFPASDPVAVLQPAPEPVLEDEEAGKTSPASPP
jgi:hypothetical protein